jgi:hypothetical protein
MRPILRGGKSIIFIEGSQALPFCPFEGQYKNEDMGVARNRGSAPL